jgi:DNA invertase Pin-like site-specific DNA recombinase
MAAIRAQEKVVELGKKGKRVTVSPYDRRSGRYQPVYTEDQIRLVLKLHNKGIKRADIARELGFQPHTVNNIYNRYRIVKGKLRKTWR